MSDAVNHPSHYTKGKIEVIDFIEDQQLGFHLGNVVKYVARADAKGKMLEDLEKARWYLDRKIAQIDPPEVIIHALRPSRSRPRNKRRA